MPEMGRVEGGSPTAASPRRYGSICCTAAVARPPGLVVLGFRVGEDVGLTPLALADGTRTRPPGPLLRPSVPGGRRPPGGSWPRLRAPWRARSGGASAPKTLPRVPVPRLALRLRSRGSEGRHCQCPGRPPRASFQRAPARLVAVSATWQHATEPQAARPPAAHCSGTCRPARRAWGSLSGAAHGNASRAARLPDRQLVTARPAGHCSRALRSH